MSSGCRGGLAFGVLCMGLVLSASGGAAPVGGAFAAPEPGAESYHLVIAVDRRGAEHYEILVEADLKQRQVAIALEDRLFNKALRETETVWRRHSEFGRKPFPRSDICPLKVTLVKTHATYEAAERARLAMEEERDILQKREEARQRRDDRERDRRMSRLYSRKAIGPPPKRTQTKAEMKQVAAEARLMNRYKDDARDLFDTTLARMVSDGVGNSIPYARARRSGSGPVRPPDVAAVPPEAAPVIVLEED